MRIMALDVGDKTIGVAVTDAMGWSAQGVCTIRRGRLEKDCTEIKKYLREYGVETLVVGLPLRANGEIGIQAKKVLEFIKLLKKNIMKDFSGLKIKTWDESMTTADAHEILAQARVTSKKRKKVIDKLAAVLILESYLNAHSPSG